MTSVGSVDGELDHYEPEKKDMMVDITAVQENHVGSILGQSPWLEYEGTDAGEISVAEQMKHDCTFFHLLYKEVLEGRVHSLLILNPFTTSNTMPSV